MRHNGKRVLLCLVLGLGCAAEPETSPTFGRAPHGHEHEAHDPSASPWGSHAGAVTCDPKLIRYPVNGPHNGGYDKNALTYTCPGHPSSSPDNSDFIGGDHYGNDIFAALGTPMVAPVNGTVTAVGETSIGGRRVTIRDACGWSYYHAHLDVIDPGVVKGMAITAGTPIGTVGKTGNASGTSPHLHFSIYPDGCYECGVDPFPYLQAVDHTACGASCDPHCEGTKIIADNCGVGDCGAFGLTCVNPPGGGGPNCASSGCTPGCKGTVMVGADCSEGDCGAFGAQCAMKGGSPTCELSCTPQCKGSVTVAADCSQGDCGAFGAQCVMSGGKPTCVLACSPHCEGTVIVGSDCSKGDCGAFGATCKMVNGQPTCEAPSCQPSCDGANVVKADCSTTNCAASGQTCVQTANGPACGQGCTPTCQGTQIVAADCSKGDCGAFGLNCTMQGGYPHCQTACTPHCEGSIVVDAACGRSDCAPAGKVCIYDANAQPKCGCRAHCDGHVAVDAQCGRGDCGAFGVTCGLYGDGPKCVAAADKACQEGCVGDQVKHADCTLGNCGAFGLTCGIFNKGVECAVKACTPHCEGTKVIGASCAEGDCGVFGLDCSMWSGEPTCVVPSCLNAAGNPENKDVCFAGSRWHCSSTGAIEEKPCPGGQECNACAGCGPAPVEVCDAKDNDCDGVIDEGVKNACGACGVSEEICDYADNDCDGTVDEGLRNACNLCGAVPSEVCDYADNDCDGAIDEDVKNACGLCGPEPVELCDYQDNDCDGQLDEDFDFVGVGCTLGFGVCKAPGVVQCTADGLATLCSATAGAPETEECNGVDDDCDGVVDNGFDVGGGCTVGDGKCSAPGLLVCEGGLAVCQAVALDCTDTDPCTVDACDPAEGCTHTAVTPCCNGEAGCGDGFVCVDGGCVGVLCAPCGKDADCPMAGARCLGYAQGGRCAVACGPDSECPEGFDCQPPHRASEGGPVCVAADGLCECASSAGTVCVGDSVFGVDSCGTPTALVSDCYHGCADGACLSQGAEADSPGSDDLGDQPADVSGGSGDAGGPGAAADTGGASGSDTKASGEGTHEDVVAGGKDPGASDAVAKDGGCAAHSRGGSPAAAVALVLLGLALVRRRDAVRGR